MDKLEGIDLGEEGVVGLYNYVLELKWMLDFYSTSHLE